MKDNKTPCIKIRFFNNNLPSKKDGVFCWERGAVYMETNKSLGIKSLKNPVMFNTFEGIPDAIDKVMKQLNIITCR